MAVNRIYSQVEYDDGDRTHRYVQSEAVVQWAQFDSTASLTTREELFIAGFLQGYAFFVSKERFRDVPDTGVRP
jgi:hypothetical protein